MPGKMSCGHQATSLASSDEGTTYCRACAFEPVAPSSLAARARGCTCPGGDTPDGNGLNSSGLVAYGDQQVWAVAADCPVHARNLPATEHREDEHA